MALGNGTPHKSRSHEIVLNPYRLQISRMVDGVKPERTDCGNVISGRKPECMRVLQFCNHSWDAASRPNAPAAYLHVGKHTKASLTTTSSLESEAVNIIDRFCEGQDITVRSNSSHKLSPSKTSNQRRDFSARTRAEPRRIE